MTDQEKREFLQSHGWSTWYNKDYWVHEKTVLDPKIQNHYEYGLSLNDAYKFETEDMPPFKPAYITLGYGGAHASKIIHGSNNAQS